MSIYLTPKDIAERLQVDETTARREMRKMPHKGIGKNGDRLRVTEQAFEAYMKPDPPLPKPPSMRRQKQAQPQAQQPRAIPYRKRGGETP